MIYTIGHSNRKWDEFLQLLKEFEIQLLMDVRTIPRSRFNPHFNSTALAKFLPQEGIEYMHIKELGGLRKPKPDSPHKGWRNEGFRGYADHMMTPEFNTAIEKAIDISNQKRTAFMCAEAVYWKCHRMLLSDALTIRNVKVEHILQSGKSEPHQLTDFAEVSEQTLLYK